MGGDAVTEPGSRVQPHVFDLRKIADERGNLTPIEGNIDVPFEIRRVYYLYDVPGGESRAGHAHRELQQVIIAASGSFDVHLDDGNATQVFQLNRSYRALYVPPMQWRDLRNFSSGSVCLVLASEHFDESDYYRDHEAFLRAAAAAR
jgi:oxalate decarboxylase/phosphoglucose isomerase-like protein (cupin superfamily)